MTMTMLDTFKLFNAEEALIEQLKNFVNQEINSLDYKLGIRPNNLIEAQERIELYKSETQKDET